MKGQAQAVTAVLVTTVIIGAIATSYTWGVPLLEKQQSQAQLDRTEENVQSLYTQIVDVSESGEGTTTRFDLGQGVSTSDMRVQLNTSGNYIDIRTSRQNPPYPIDTWTLIRGNNLQNTSVGTGAYGRPDENLPGIVAVRVVGAPDQSLITYRVEFRNQLSETPSGRQLSRVNLTAEAQSASSGDTTLFISNQGNEWERGNNAVELPSGERVPRRNTNILIGFR